MLKGQIQVKNNTYILCKLKGPPVIKIKYVCFSFGQRLLDSHLNYQAQLG